MDEAVPRWDVGGYLWEAGDGIRVPGNLNTPTQNIKCTYYKIIPLHFIVNTASKYIRRQGALLRIHTY